MQSQDGFFTSRQIIHQVLNCLHPQKKLCFQGNQRNIANVEKTVHLLNKSLPAVKKSWRTNKHHLMQSSRKFSTAKLGYFEKTKSKDCLLFVVKC